MNVNDVVEDYYSKLLNDEEIPDQKFNYYASGRPKLMSFRLLKIIYNYKQQT